MGTREAERSAGGAAGSWPALLALSAAAAWSAGCELTAVEVAEPEDVVVAEVVLRTDDAVQRAWLYRTLGGRADGDRRVGGATVRVIGDADTLVFVEEPLPGPCVPDAVPTDGSCYVAVHPGRSSREPIVPEPWIVPGGAYRLEIELADGGRLAGATDVPEAFRLVQPDHAVCEGTGPVELVWTRSEGAWSYQVVGYFDNLAAGLLELGVEDPPNSLELLGLGISAADTTLVFPSELGVFDRFSLERDLLLALQQGLPSGASADVIVAAGDRNYVNWIRGGNFNPSGQIRVPSVSGDGTGVFGAVVARWLRIENPETDRPTPPLPSCQ